MSIDWCDACGRYHGAQAHPGETPVVHADTTSIYTDTCDGCGETVSHIDAGFSPALHEMKHDCGGTWR